MLRCPHYNCNFTTTNLMNLRKHIAFSHPLNGECPICRKKFSRLLSHLFQKTLCRDKKHAVFYALYRRNTGVSELSNWARDVAVSKLEVNDSDV